MIERAEINSRLNGCFRQQNTVFTGWVMYPSFFCALCGNRHNLSLCVIEYDIKKKGDVNNGGTAGQLFGSGRSVM